MWIGLATVAFGLCLSGFLLAPGSVPEVSRFRFDLAQIRSLAAGRSESLPTHVDVSIVAESTKPAVGVFGGLRFDTVTFVWTSFQIVFPGHFVLVDAPPGSPGVQRALRNAEWILVTHEHPDHLGGISQSPHMAEFGERLRLTQEQAAEVAGPAGTLRAARIHDGPARIAPGVVVVPAPGHTPGSQLVYIQQENGCELLLVGDVAWARSQFERPIGRPRISAWLMDEDSAAVGHQLRRLNELRAEPGLDIVVSHDRDQLAAYLAEGVLGSADSPASVRRAACSTKRGRLPRAPG